MAIGIGDFLRWRSDKVLIITTLSSIHPQRRGTLVNFDDECITIREKGDNGKDVCIRKEAIVSIEEE